MFENYLDLVCEIVGRIKEIQGASIRKAARVVADTIINGGWVYTFGSGHSELLAREIHARAGGLYPIVHIPDPMTGRAERLEGFGEILVNNIPFKQGETIIIISNSGRNPAPIEVAMHAKKMGLNVIVLTSMEHTKLVASRHSSGKKLYELGDIVIDSSVPSGDAGVTLGDFPAKVGALSTVLGAAILNAVVLEAVQYMLDQGQDPPVLISFNLDGSAEHNTRVIERFGQLPGAMGMMIAI